MKHVLLWSVGIGLIFKSLNAALVTWVKQLVTGFSLRGTRFLSIGLVCGTCDGQNGNGAGFLLSLLFHHSSIFIYHMQNESWDH